MEPNEALRVIRATIKQMLVEDRPVGETLPQFVQHARDLADTVTGLDEWLSKDGFLPDDWRSDDEENETVCGCGYPLVWVDDHWEHNVAPSYWGNDHDPDPHDDHGNRTTPEYT